MLIVVVLLVTGAVVLYAGADLAVRGATRFARAAGIPAFLLGALLFGVDLEGTGTAIVAAARGQTQIAVGEIFGAVLFLFSAAFGAALLFARRPVPAPEPVMVMAPSICVAAAAMTLYDRFVDRLEGGLLVLLYAGYVLLVLRRARAEEPAPAGGRVRPALAALTGVLLLAVGAAMLVAGGTGLVGRTALLPGFVGAAVVGVLASLDEVLLEILPIRRGTPDLATGNLFGTLAAFSSGVLGVAALVRPLDVDGAGNAAFLGMAILYAVVAVTFLVRGRAGRVLGGTVLLAYAAWLGATASV